MTNLNAIREQMITKLNAVFVELDAKVAEQAREWGIARRDAIKAKREEMQPKRREINSYVYYDALFAAAGGKTWYNALSDLNDAGVIATMDKNTQSVIAKRNDNIATKLNAIGATEVVSSEFARTNDGFNGTFIVETNKGRKTITIQSIYAGGYNIQCFHIRVLVRVS